MSQYDDTLSEDNFYPACPFEDCDRNQNGLFTKRSTVQVGAYQCLACDRHFGEGRPEVVVVAAGNTTDRYHDLADSSTPEAPAPACRPHGYGETQFIAVEREAAADHGRLCKRCKQRRESE